MDYIFESKNRGTWGPSNECIRGAPLWGNNHCYENVTGKRNISTSRYIKGPNWRPVMNKLLRDKPSMVEMEVILVGIFFGLILSGCLLDAIIYINK